VAGGALLAAALWFTPKVVYAGGGAVLALLLPSEIVPSLPRRLAMLAWICLGGALVSGAMILVMARLDILHAFVASCLPANLAMRADNPAAVRLFDLRNSIGENLMTWLLGVAGLALVLVSRPVRSNGTARIVAVSFVTGFVGLFLNRVPLRQTHLTFVPQLAVLGGMAAAELLALVRRRWSPRAASAALVALLGLCLVPPALAVPRRFANQEMQLTVLRRVLEATQSHERVFDCWTGLYLTRLPALYYYHLNSDVLRLLDGEELAASLMNRLRDPEVKAVIRDRYFDRLPANVRSYVLDRFQPLPGCVVVLIRRP
jgi:hypothetical protein